MKFILSIGFVFAVVFNSSANEIESTTCDYSLRDSIAIYAQEQLGTPYVWGGTSEKGFDCSGFVMFVYKKFGILLPHSSKSMANLGAKKDQNLAETGDLILFQGRSSSTVGHVGIVYNNLVNDELIFIHSSSPRSGGVIFSSLNETYYKTRFIKVVDILSAD